MAQVSNQAQLLEALAAREAVIQAVSDFTINTQINILYEVTIESLTKDNPFTITKDISYSAYLFRVQSGGSLTLQNIILDGNGANHPIENQNNRSLINVTGGTLNLLEGSVIQNNNAYLEGGGIYINRNETYPNTLKMNGNAQITGCYSRTSGGGIMLAVGNPQDSFYIGGNVTIEQNHGANGGGILCRSYTQDVSSILSIGDDVQIINNTANSNGGGIYFSGFSSGGTTASALTLFGNVLISGNRAVNGGGIYFNAANSDDHLTLTENTVITKNTALQNGGGLNVRTNSSFTNVSVINASITDNTANTGGGMYILTDSGASLNFSEIFCTGNRAVNETSGTGGGIWINNQSQNTGISAVFTNITLENNQASVHGGGMALYAGGGTLSFQMTEGSVSNNLASQEGGGFVISNEGTGKLIFDRSVFSQNTANGSGGGIYYANTGSGSASEFTMTEVTISNNTAGRTGGGLRLASGSGPLTTLLDSCTVILNTALENSGGGIWNGGNNDSLTLKGTTTVTQNSTHSGNGGGIYFNSINGTMLLTDEVKITNNKADVVSTDFGNHGGGICLVPGILTIQNNAEISSNTAQKYGGGISAAEGSQIIMLGGTIKDNISRQFGGGIWNHGSSSTTLTGGSIVNNTAIMGNGIYNDSDLYMEGTRDLSDGVYIATASSIVRILNALTGLSAIQLELSPHVTPNITGTPIVVGEAASAYPLLSRSDADAFLKPKESFEYWEIILSDDSTQVLLSPINYTIQYENLLGSANPNPPSYTVTTPTIELLPLNNISGYRFVGWFDSVSGGNQINSIPQGSTGNITLYARWEEITQFYTITFCANDKCFSRACNIPAQITIQGEQDVTLPTVIPQRNNYRFLFWNTDCHGKGHSYLPGDTINFVDSDLCLYAIWEQNSCDCPCSHQKGNVL